jgi:hypothetical protein
VEYKLGSNRFRHWYIIERVLHIHEIARVIHRAINCFPLACIDQHYGAILRILIFKS